MSDEKIRLTKNELINLYKSLQITTEKELAFNLPNSEPSFKSEVKSLILQRLIDALIESGNNLVIDGIDVEENNISIKEILEFETLTDEQLALEIKLEYENLSEKIDTKFNAITHIRRELPGQAMATIGGLVTSADHEVKNVLQNVLQNPVPSDFPSVINNVSNDVMTDYSQSILNLYQVRNDLPLHENKIKALKQVTDFMFSVYDGQNGTT